MTISRQYRGVERGIFICYTVYDEFLRKTQAHKKRLFGTIRKGAFIMRGKGRCEYEAVGRTVLQQRRLAILP